MMYVMYAKFYYVTRKGSRLTSAQSSVTALDTVLSTLLTLDIGL